jgi:outer membrane protein TolC
MSAYKWLSGLTLVILSQQACGEVYSLLEVYEIARQNDPGLGFSRYQVDGSKASRDVAQGQIFPQVSIFGDWSDNKVRYEDTQLGAIPNQEYPGERYGLQLRAPIFNIKSWREFERRQALVSQSEQELGVAEAALLAQVSKAYLEVLLAAEDLLAYEAELTALEGEYAEAQALYERSLISITSVLEAQTRLDLLRADAVQAKGQLAISRERLIQKVGIRDVTTLPIVPEIMLPSGIDNPERAAALAVRFNTAVAAKTEAVAAAKKAVAREKGSWWPEIDFVYNSQYSDVGFDNLTSPPRSSESYSVSFTYPIFEGGAGSARIRGAWAEFYGAQQKLEEAKRAASGEARAAWLNYQAKNEGVAAAAQAFKTAEVNAEVAKEAVSRGVGRVADVLVALAQRTRSQRTLNQARFERALIWLELELATGGDPLRLAGTLSEALHGQ